MTKSTVPQHVAIIMDGNRRWARQHSLSLLQGHQKVAREIIERLVKQAIARQVAYLTLWAFSTENWKRDNSEVEGLMVLFREAFGQNAAKFHEQGVRIKTIGDLSRFPADIRQNIEKWVTQTAQNSTITVVFALNYGGRAEIVRATNKLLEELRTDSAGQPTITEERFTATLDTAGLPDPDLIIRPGGEQRLSGFLPWQSVYTELYFTDTLMPAFDEAAFDAALAEYQTRARRFGN